MKKDKYFFVDETRLGNEGRKNLGYGLSSVLINDYNPEIIFNLLKDFYIKMEESFNVNLNLDDKILIGHFSDWSESSKLNSAKRDQKKLIEIIKVINFCLKENDAIFVSSISDKKYKTKRTAENAARRMVRILVQRSWLEKKSSNKIHVIFDNKELYNELKKCSLNDIFDKLNLSHNKHVLNKVVFHFSPKHPITNIADIIVGIHSIIFKNKKYNYLKKEINGDGYGSILI